MKFSRSFRYYWWVLVLILFTGGLYLRSGAILGGQAQFFDTVLLAVVAALILLPLYSEFSVLGLTLKQQVDEAKREIKSEIRSEITALQATLRADVRNALQSTQNVMVNTAISDKQLEDLASKFLSQTQAAQSKPVPSPNAQSVVGKYGVDSGTELAFIARYQIETRLQTLLRRAAAIEGHESAMPPSGTTRMINEARVRGLITPVLAESLAQVTRISNKAIHGEPPTVGETNFLVEVLEPLLFELDAAMEQFGEM